MSAFAPIDDLFIAEVSDTEQKYVYAIRARTEAAAQRKLHTLLREQWPEEMAKHDENERGLYTTLTQYHFTREVTQLT